jgi:macrolide transport system ATP-binding/permease protein
MSSEDAWRVVAKLLGYLCRGRAERELRREIDSHLALLQDEFERRGMPSGDARVAARRAYGGVEQAKELHRDERSFVWLEQLSQDLRHACRGLRRNPGFTLVAVITMALGIGVNTTLFNAFNAVALKPLPVADPDHVMRFERWFQSRGLGNGQYAFSYPEYDYCRHHGDLFDALVAASWIVTVRGSLPDSDAPQRLAGQLVSANYFADFGIPPLVGRGFLTGEDRIPGANAVVVLSYSFWKRAFGGDLQVLGQVVKLNGAAFTIIGVTPQKFTGTSVDPQVPDFWAPLSMQAQLVPGQDWLHQPEVRLFQIFARLKPSQDLAPAQAQADLLIRQYGTTYEQRDKTTAVTLQRTTYFPNTDDIRFRALVAASMLIVGLVLLAACANVGNMLLARGAGRQREISTRIALGAGRGRVIRQLVVESIVLSCLGGVAGLVTSVAATRLLGILIQQNAMLINGDFFAVDIAPDGRVIAYVLAVSLGAGVLLGFSPALQFARRDIIGALKNEGSSLGPQVGGSRLRNLLVATQVTVSMLLLATAGLLTRGLVRSRAADPQFDSRHAYLLLGSVGVPGADPADVIARQRQLVERLRVRPEVAAVALGDSPFRGTWTPPMSVTAGQGRLTGRTLASYASETYFDTLGITLVRGRTFIRQEAAGSAPLAVISESAARYFWPGQDALGRPFTLDLDFRGTLATFEVIGIVKDIRYANLTRIDPAHVYLSTNGPHAANDPGAMDILLRIQGDREQALRAVENSVAAFDQDLASSLRLINVEEGLVQIQRAMSQALATLAAILAALALTLAGVGVYGVVACVVSQRTKEIGVRMALGATHGAVLKSVVLQGLRPVFAGMTVGLAAAAALSSLLHQTLVFPGSMDFFYGVPFYDPATFAGLSCFVVGIAALAGALPVRRALRAGPMAALRYE